MNLWFSLFALAVLILIPTAGASIEGLRGFLGVVIPYAALLIFIVGFIYLALN